MARISKKNKALSKALEAKIDKIRERRRKDKENSYIPRIIHSTMPRNPATGITRRSLNYQTMHSSSAAILQVTDDNTRKDCIREAKLRLERFKAIAELNKELKKNKYLTDFDKEQLKRRSEMIF